MKSTSANIAVIGSGIVGIATAYYLAKIHGLTLITLIDKHQPMSFTSAQSGENYRNWWPHPSMVAFTNRSIDLLESVALDTNNRINMNRRGYSLATRQSNIDDLVKELHYGFGDRAAELIRYHEARTSKTYQPPRSPHWNLAPDGVDILTNQDLIRDTFQSYSTDVQSLIHIRRGGDISGQQLGMYMLEFLKERGCKHVRGTVESITEGESYTLDVRTCNGTVNVHADQLINAAGPFANDIATMLDVELPVHNSFQQKIAFEDRKAVIPRKMPFSIDLDRQLIDWTDEERELIREDSCYSWLAEEMPGSIHCRPDGDEKGRWVKLGWAYNQKLDNATWEPPLDDNFPDIVLRGATRLNPALKAYYGQLPRNMHHYGGWYTMTNENWPLIGPMGPDGVFMNCAHSGFGTMAACAAGELCAAWVAGTELPEYAYDFSMNRYDNEPLMQLLRDAAKGVL